MKRGFKAEAERIAIELRSEVNLEADERLNPFELAEHLAIPVLGLEEVSRSSTVNHFGSYFTEIDPDSFSAVTIFRGRARLIVHNDSHHANRQASNLAHEISHTVLEHDPTALVNDTGQRYWNAEVEEEANWLGAALLVPREAALAMMRAGQTVAQIAAHFGVSEALSKWRISQTGILQQIRRSRRWGN